MLYDLRSTMPRHICANMHHDSASDKFPVTFRYMWVCAAISLKLNCVWKIARKVNQYIIPRTNPHGLLRIGLDRLIGFLRRLGILRFISVYVMTVVRSSTIPVTVDLSAEMTISDKRVSFFVDSVLRFSGHNCNPLLHCYMGSGFGSGV